MMKRHDAPLITDRRQRPEGGCALVTGSPGSAPPGEGEEEEARMRVGGREDEEVSRKLKSMEVDKADNGEESPRPAIKYHGWKAMPFIIGNETFEKLGTLGTSANLLVYLTQVFHMRSVDAATLLNGLNGTTSLAPIIGAFLSDAYLGRYLALAIASIASLIVSPPPQLLVSAPCLIFALLLSSPPVEFVGEFDCSLRLVDGFAAAARFSFLTADDGGGKRIHDALGYHLAS
ncbi:hypothetical protein HU200_045283 [Digitaria exilis]|uniref:Uncharacterized protein n=1 Tax=Digitaria exilis TaxID=1010633 RepID=A0A835B808_9POAL|nr:hypothetical protein HU200_045283 [Digitaria exilis]